MKIVMALLVLMSLTACTTLSGRNVANDQPYERAVQN